MAVHRFRKWILDWSGGGGGGGGGAQTSAQLKCFWARVGGKEKNLTLDNSYNSFCYGLGPKKLTA